MEDKQKDVINKKNSKIEGGFIINEDFIIRISSISKIVKEKSLDNNVFFIGIYTNGNRFCESLDFSTKELMEIGYKKIKEGLMLNELDKIQ